MVSCEEYTKEVTNNNMREDVTMIYTLIKKLVQYGLKTGLIAEEDVIFTTNRLLELFELDAMDEDACTADSNQAEVQIEVLEEIL